MYQIKEFSGGITKAIKEANEWLSKTKNIEVINHVHTKFHDVTILYKIKTEEPGEK